MQDVALEVPLAPLVVGRFFQGDHPGTARVQMLGESLDGAALARGVPSLEQQRVTGAGRLHPALEFQQLDLQQPLLVLVLVPVHPRVVRIALAPGVHDLAAGRPQDRVVVVIVLDSESARAVLLLEERQLVGEISHSGIMSPRASGSWTGCELSANAPCVWFWFIRRSGCAPAVGPMSTRCDGAPYSAPTPSSASESLR